MKTATLAARRWWYIMPIVFITYSLAYLDRANYGFAAASGMAADLMITPGLSSLLGALFFLGYFFFQVPGAIYAQKHSVKKLIFFSLIFWGGLATLTGVVSNAYWLIVIRFMLGVVEAAVMPAMLVYLCHWFTRAERSRANTFLILGNPVTMLWMSVVSGYLVQHFSWRWMFIIEGLPAVIWAFIWWKLADDRPAQAKWLSEQEKARPGKRSRRRTGRDQSGEELRRSIPLAEGDHSGAAVFLLEHRRLRLCAVVAVDPQGRRTNGHDRGRLAVGAAVSGGGDRHARGVVGLGQTAEAQTLRLAATADRIHCVLRLLRPGRGTFLVVVHAAGDRRRLHVRALRAVLRHRSGDPSGQRCRRRDGADQQHGRWARSAARIWSAI